jgi:hypothetical protein
VGEAGNTEGSSAAELVEVAFAGDLGEAEMIQGLLESGGISSLLRPTGVDGRTIGAGLLPPGFLRAGRSGWRSTRTRRMRLGAC